MLYTILAMILTALPLGAMSQSHSGEPITVQADELRAWYDQDQPIIVIDARSAPYFEGTLLPNAHWLPYDSTEEAIGARLLDKASRIVVYCWSVECPASGWLYEKLNAMGYQNVYEYREGLEDWVQKGYPVTKAPR